MNNKELLKEKARLVDMLRMIDNELESNTIKELEMSVGKYYVEKTTEFTEQDDTCLSYYYVHTLNKTDLSLFALRISKYSENDYSISTHECLASVRSNAVMTYKEINKKQFMEIYKQAINAIEQINK